MAQINPQQAGGLSGSGLIRSQAETASGIPVWQFSKSGKLSVHLGRSTYRSPPRSPAVG